MKSKTLKINNTDNIEIALSDLKAGEPVSNDSGTYNLITDVQAKHKFATVDLHKGDEVLMYGVLVGKANKTIKKGEVITRDNISHASGSYKLKERKISWELPEISSWKDKTFMGYHRENGKVGVANYWLVIPLVFCENKNVQVIQDAFMKGLGYYDNDFSYYNQVQQLVKMHRAGMSKADILNVDLDLTDVGAGIENRVFPNVDGVKFLTHSLGCGGTKDDAINLCGLLAGYITHANVAGATVLSLGCQNAQISLLKEQITKRDPAFNKPLYCFEHQQVGSESELINQAIKQTFAGLMEANEYKRKPAPLSKLCIGLECGGSDGFSGISANPALGHTSDLLVALGSSVILSEFPELCGVEQELSDRCLDESTAKKFMSLMTAYHERAKAVGSDFDSNPSAGNIRDGLITDAIKSAGAAKKAGTSPVIDVLDYPEQVSKPGLTLLCTPGSDIESTTAEVGAGATLVFFTTGLGTPTGNPIAPVVKISTNTTLYKKMNDIIDINAGTIITGEETIKQVGERIMDYIIEIASGQVRAKAETLGHNDFIPWKRGISL